MPQEMPQAAPLASAEAADRSGVPGESSQAQRAWAARQPGYWCLPNLGRPGSRPIPALQYFQYVFSLLALKLAGTERLSHTDDHNFDQGLRLFAGLNVLPKCTALSTYAYSLDRNTVDPLQATIAATGHRLGLYQSPTINLDFHAVPH
jgi:hypothetical protein